MRPAGASSQFASVPTRNPSTKSTGQPALMPPATRALSSHTHAHTLVLTRMPGLPMPMPPVGMAPGMAGLLSGMAGMPVVPSSVASKGKADEDEEDEEDEEEEEEDEEDAPPAKKAKKGNKAAI